MPPTHLSPDQVATMLPGISRAQLAQLRYRGDGRDVAREEEGMALIPDAPFDPEHV